MEFANDQGGQLSAIIEGDTLTISVEGTKLLLSRMSNEKFEKFTKLHERATTAARAKMESKIPPIDIAAVEKLNLFGSDHTFKDYKAVLHLESLREFNNADNEVLDTLVVKSDIESAEYEFRIPEEQSEIRVFGVGSRTKKTDYFDELTQNYFIARAPNRNRAGVGGPVAESVGASVSEGKLHGFMMAGTFFSGPRALTLTKTMRDQIHADIIADQRTMPIFVFLLKEKHLFLIPVLALGGAALGRLIGNALTRSK